MPLASLTGTDFAGGILLPGAAHQVTVGGVRVAVLGDPVVSHGEGAHAGATMVAASSTVTIGGQGIVRAGDAASCGHTSSGSSHVEVGS